MIAFLVYRTIANLATLVVYACAGTAYGLAVLSAGITRVGRALLAWAQRANAWHIAARNAEIDDRLERLRRARVKELR